MPGAITAEVWGSPVSHSKSPDLHLSCYRHLGIDGSYTRREVTADTLPSIFADARTSLNGISLTMPLKEGMLDLVADHRGDVDVLRASNTAVLGAGGWWLANTDPYGAGAMCKALLPPAATTVWVLGAGATARAVLAGLHRSGFTGDVIVAVRSVPRAQAALEVAEALQVPARAVSLEELPHAPDPDLIISTLPSGIDLYPKVVASCTARGAPLMDVGYHPWPTPLAKAFTDAHLLAYSGLPMLMFQALAQIRCFINGDPGIALPDERGALSAMARAIGVDTEWADPTLMGQ